jgi:SAM-dependent methyltransferase
MDKTHWYDGWFYDRIIAPNQDRLFDQISNLIKTQSSIIDVGCGTGRLAFAQADKSRSVLGIDLSRRNIKRARLNLLHRPNHKISFQHHSISEIIKDEQIHFDYAVLTYVIHEVDEDERINLLNEIALVTDKIIIGDYLAPKSDAFAGNLTEAIEFMAGRDHYRNYKSYMEKGGLYYLANNSRLKIISEQKNQTYNHIVTLSK